MLTTPGGCKTQRFLCGQSWAFWVGFVEPDEVQHNAWYHSFRKLFFFWGTWWHHFHLHGLLLCYWPVQWVVLGSVPLGTTQTKKTQVCIVRHVCLVEMGDDIRRKDFIDGETQQHQEFVREDEVRSEAWHVTVIWVESIWINLNLDHAELTDVEFSCVFFDFLFANVESENCFRKDRSGVMQCRFSLGQEQTQLFTSFHQLFVGSNGSHGPRHLCLTSTSMVMSISLALTALMSLASMLCSCLSPTSSRSPTLTLPLQLGAN